MIYQPGLSVVAEAPAPCHLSRFIESSTHCVLWAEGNSQPEFTTAESAPQLRTWNALVTDEFAACVSSVWCQDTS